MNILHIEEMMEVEKGLLVATPQEQYLLHMPNNEEVTRLHDSSPCALPPCSLEAQQEIDKMLTHTKNLRSLKKKDLNAALKVFSCAMLSIIYPQAAGSKTAPINYLLLETLKCTLYSTDLNFSSIVGFGKFIDDVQGKAMVARFFDVLAVEKNALGSNFCKYVELFIQKNPIITTIFVLFYRLVLNKLTVERAEEFNTAVNFEQAIINLSEYFEISYRYRPDLSLFYEENLFIAQAADQVILGEYLDNEIDPRQVSFKDSQGFNFIQSFLLRSSQHECRQRFHQKQKQAPKVFDFSFENGQFRFIKGENEQGTPHFDESTQYVFGRKKKQQQTVLNDEQLKKQMPNMNLNASIDSFKDFNFNQCMGILKTIQQREKILNNAKLNILNETMIFNPKNKNKEHFHNPIKQIDEKLEQSNIGKDRRNIVNVKDKHISLLTPQVSINSHECFTKMDNDVMFLKESNILQPFSGSENMDEAKSDQFAISCCKCRAYRLTRNSLASTVVNYSYIPAQKKRTAVRPPPFLNNLSHSQNLVLYGSSRLKSPKVERQKTLDEKLTVESETKLQPKFKEMEQVKQQRRPTFLKFLKKKREMGQKQSLLQIQTSKKSLPTKQSNTDMFIDKQKYKRQDIFKRLSDIQNTDKDQKKTKDLQNRETLNKNDFHFYFPKKKPIQSNTMLKKLDINNLLDRQNFGNNWQSITNFRQVTQTQRRQTRQNISNTVQIGQKVTRLYTPTVHIITPAIYLHPDNNRNCQSIFNVSPQSSQKGFWKDSSRIFKTQPSIELVNEMKRLI